LVFAFDFSARGRGLAARLVFFAAEGESDREDEGESGSFLEERAMRKKERKIPAGAEKMG